MTNLEWLKEKLRNNELSEVFKWFKEHNIKGIVDNSTSPATIMIDSNYLDIYLSEHVEKPKTVWDLKINDKYYIIYCDGAVFCRNWDNSNNEIRYRSQGNVFLTEEEAKFEARRREVYMIAKKYSHKFNSKEWSDVKIGKWAPYYCMIDGELKIVESLSIKEALLYFKSKDDVEKQRLITELGVKEDFIKYYLGVD